MNVANSFVIYAGGQAINSLLRFLLVPYYSYALSIDDFGKMGMVWIIIPLLTTVAGLGATVSVSIKYYKVSDEIRTKMINFLLLTVTLSFFCLTSGALLLRDLIENFFLLDISALYYSKIVIIAYTAFLIEFFLCLFKTQLKPGKFVIYNFAYSSISILLIIFYILYLKAGFLGFLDATLWGNIIIAALLLLDYLRGSPSLKIRINQALCVDLMKIGLPVVIGFLLSYAMNYSGRYLLANLTKSFTSVGIYTMGTKFGEAFNLFFVTSYLTAVTPIMLKKYCENIYDHDDYKAEMVRFCNIYILASGLLFLFANSILQAVFRVCLDLKYLDSIIIVQLTFVSYIIFGLGQFFNMSFLVKERLSVTTYFAGIAGILSILLNMWLIPRFQIMGTMLTSLVTYSVCTLLSYYYAQKILPIRFQYKKNLVFVAIIGGCFFLQIMADKMFTENLFLNLISKLVVFLLLCTFMKVSHFYDEFELICSKIRERLSI